MSAAQQGFGLLVLVVGGIVLAAILSFAGYALRIVPMTRSRRGWVARFAPIVAALAGFLYVLFFTRQAFRESPESLPFAMALVLCGCGAASWFAVRDYLAGVFLKAGRVLQVGDHVQIGDVKGRVSRLGYRVASLETGQGDEAIVPFSRIARESILRTPVLEGMALHVFRMEAPTGVDVSEVRRTIRHGALLCHWSSIVREPEIESLEGGQLEVTVFSIDRDRVADVESAVRESLTRLSKPK
jgi:small-conductance mechanosensitive channel